MAANLASSKQAAAKSSSNSQQEQPASKNTTGGHQQTTREPRTKARRSAMTMSDDNRASDGAAPEKRPTLLRPPEPDPSRAMIENSVEVTEIGVLGPDIFTNTRQPVIPRGQRGIFGGVVIAQCLASAQLTVQDNFLAHSCHCYFLLAGSATIPILYHVERVRDGRSFSTRTVQARQRGRCIFTTTISFVREDSGGARQVRYAASLPDDVEPPTPGWDEEEPDWWAPRGPCQNRPAQLLGLQDPAAPPDQRKCRQWLRCRGRISDEGGRQAHLNALAYMSDCNFIGAVARINQLWRLPVAPEDVRTLSEDRLGQLRQMAVFEGLGPRAESWAARPQVGMIVSLDHSIYFHEPKRVRADEWILTEMDTPWSGDGRGVVVQKMFAKDGTLLATCFQEGVIRLQQDEPEKASKL